MNDESVAAICLTHIGKRLNHEDNYYFDKQYLPIEIQKNMVNIKLIYNSSENNAPIRYFAVSDGMGGHNAGEVASYICVKTGGTGKPNTKVFVTSGSCNYIAGGHLRNKYGCV